jgi:hypothetical protein
VTRALTINPRIREQVLRDPRYPVRRIADHLLPYLRVLVDQFRPLQVILFGSYANGSPGPHSDVDLLIVMPIRLGRVRDKVAIRRAWWPLLRSGPALSFDLLLASPQEFDSPAWRNSTYHSEILRTGVPLT